MQSCRKALDNLDRAKGANASLLMARYLRETKGKGENNAANQTAIQARADLFSAMKHAAINVKPLYKLAFDRRDRALKDVGANFRCFETNGPMVIGLGGSNVLETGLTLNPTYGTPMIPGSSLKGVVAHYCSEVLGATDADYRAGGTVYEALFGTESTAQEQSAGYIRFYDAWMVPESVEKAFVDDVMTPHHGDYYSGNADRPTDFDDPNPVTFLTLKGQFKVWLACEEPDEAKRSEWLEFVHKLVREALKSYGVGGKIRAGYGRMKAVQSAEDKQREAAKAEQQANINAGFTHAIGDTVELTCSKVDKKHEKSIFSDMDDGKPVQWVGKKPFVGVGETVKVTIKDIAQVDRSNKGYFIAVAD